MKRCRILVTRLYGYVIRSGAGKVYNYIEAFGFGSPTGIDIHGEEKGVIMDKASVKNVDLAEDGLWAGFGCYTLQLISGVSAVIMAAI